MTRKQLHPSGPVLAHATHMTNLDTRIVLVNAVGVLVRPPIRASLVERPRVRNARNLAPPLDELQREPLGDVEANVAVQQPGARVVRLEANDEVACARQDGRVSSQRVIRVELGDARQVNAGSLGEDEEVVAVQVDWMGDGQQAVYDEVEDNVGVGQLNDSVVPLECRLPVEDLRECRVPPVDFRRGAVQRPRVKVVLQSESDGLE